MCMYMYVYRYLFVNTYTYVDSPCLDSTFCVGGLDGLLELRLQVARSANEVITTWTPKAGNTMGLSRKGTAG